MKLDDISNLNDDMTYEEVKEEINKLDPEEKKRIRKNLVIMLGLLVIVCIFLIITLFKPVKVKNKKKTKEVIAKEVDKKAKKYIDMLKFTELDSLMGDPLSLYKEEKEISEEARKSIFIYNFKNIAKDCSKKYNASLMSDVLKMLGIKAPLTFDYLNDEGLFTSVTLKDNKYVLTCNQDTSKKPSYKIKTKDVREDKEDDFIYLYKEVSFIKEGKEYFDPDFKNPKMNITGEIKNIYKYTLVKENGVYQLYEIKKEI